jgi:thiamine pyrophosphate-dependent acetolactate synthase large subunit-like protein
MIDRRAFVTQLLKGRTGLLVVSGLGSATFDVAASGDDPLNFYLWGTMGAAAMVGLGLALARTDRRVAVFTGDGEILMGLGSLATIGAKQPPNLTIVVLDNQHWGETGMQESHTRCGIDLVGIAKACRFKEAMSFDQTAQAETARELLYSRAGPIFIHARVVADIPDREGIFPESDGVLLKHRFRQELGRTAQERVSRV